MSASAPRACRPLAALTRSQMEDLWKREQLDLKMNGINLLVSDDSGVHGCRAWVQGMGALLGAARWRQSIQSKIIRHTGRSAQTPLVLCAASRAGGAREGIDSMFIPGVHQHITVTQASAAWLANATRRRDRYSIAYEGLSAAG
jgi:hypothetical protein